MKRLTLVLCVFLILISLTSSINPLKYSIYIENSNTKKEEVLKEDKPASSSQPQSTVSTSSNIQPKIIVDYLNKTELKNNTEIISLSSLNNLIILEDLKTLKILDYNFKVKFQYEFIDKINRENMITQTNDGIAFFSNNKAFLFDKSLNLIKKMDLNFEMENNTQIKKSKDGFALITFKDIFIFDNSLNLLENVKAENVDDITEDFKTICYTNEVGFYVSDIKKENPQLIAKHENPTDDIEGKGYRYSSFIDKDKKIFVRGLGWEWTYALFIYEIEEKKLNRFEIGGGYEFSSQILENKAYCVGENFDVIDLTTLKVENHKMPFKPDTTSFFINDNFIITEFSSHSNNINSFYVETYNLTTEEIKKILIGEGENYLRIVTLQSDNTAILQDLNNIYRIKIN